MNGLLEQMQLTCVCLQPPKCVPRQFPAHLGRPAMLTALTALTRRVIRARKRIVATYYGVHSVLDAACLANGNELDP